MSERCHSKASSLGHFKLRTLQGMAEDLLYCKSSDYIMILARILGAENSSLRIKQRLESRLEVYTAPREKCYNSTS